VHALLLEINCVPIFVWVTSWTANTTLSLFARGLGRIFPVTTSGKEYHFAFSFERLQAHSRMAQPPEHCWIPLLDRNVSLSEPFPSHVTVYTCLLEKASHQGVMRITCDRLHIDQRPDVPYPSEFSAAEGGKSPPRCLRAYGGVNAG